MAAKRIILEMGTGNDLHGGDYTKAAVRAVQDALHHSSLSFLRSLGLDYDGLKAIRATHDALSSMTKGLETILGRG